MAQIGEGLLATAGVTGLGPFDLLGPPDHASPPNFLALPPEQPSNDGA
jgi:hypothetical protein